MLKRVCLIVLILSFCFGLCSCETIKGTGKGFFTGLSKDVKNTCNNVVEAGKALKRADEKFQENFW